MCQNNNMETQKALVLLTLTLAILTTSANAQPLRTDFYRSTCPNVESLVRSAVQAKFRQTFVTAPATLRLFFHDCFVRVRTNKFPPIRLKYLNFFFFYRDVTLPL